MKSTYALLLAAMLPAAAGAVSIPNPIYQPANGEIVKADGKRNGGFEAQFLVNSNNVRWLANKVRNHARRNGFKVAAFEVDENDADLKFKRRNQALDVSIKLKFDNTIKYKADLENN